jgi:hypothetical protein
VTQVSTLKDYRDVWYNTKAIANILYLSLARVKENYPARYNSDEGNHLLVIQPNNQVVFQQSVSRLYYHDTINRTVVMINTVGGNAG